MNKADIIRAASDGSLRSINSSSPTSPTFVKMIVLDVISYPNIENINEDKKSTWYGMGVSNMKLVDILPRNTIIAQRVGEHVKPMFVFPFFPSHLSLPCKPGECVWAMVEKPDATELEIAYWFCRVVEPHVSDDINHSHPGSATEVTLKPGIIEKANSVSNGSSESGENIWYEMRNAPVVITGNTRTSGQNQILRDYPNDEDIFEKLITETNASSLMTYESVPRFSKRPGDVVLEGSNNTLLVLGTNRNGSIDTINFPKEAGSIDIVTGRGQTKETSGISASTTSIVDANTEKGKKGAELKKELNKAHEFLAKSEGDPDMKNDRSRILVSQRTSVDSNFSLSDYNSKLQVADTTSGDAAIVIKTDKVRLIARSDIELVVTGFSTSNETDRKDRKDQNDDSEKWASITIKANGEIIIKPSKTSVIKLGDETADKAILCTSIAANVVAGKVKSSTIISTGGGALGDGASKHGLFASKVLVTS